MTNQFKITDIYTGTSKNKPECVLFSPSLLVVPFMPFEKENNIHGVFRMNNKPNTVKKDLFFIADFILRGGVWVGLEI